jgi:hypothetical protein
MLKKSTHKTGPLLALAAAGLLSACSPQYNWRDYHGKDAPYAVLFPGKPDSFTRTIELDGLQVSMTMAATEVDGNTFAVGSADMPDAARAQAALAAMQTAMLKNINGTVISSGSATAATALGAGASHQSSSIDMRARGTQNGRPVLLAGHFAARDKHIYQVIVLGDERRLSRDNLDMFLTSFKLD